MANLVGGWELANMTACNLPEKVATGFTQVIKGMTGAKYVPVLYVGSQIVNGTNHMIICEQTLSVLGNAKHVVKMVLNNAPSGDWFVVSIEQIV